MKKIYTSEDTNKMSREEFGEVLSILIHKIEAYMKVHNVVFDIVAPILRSWMIPATAIANKFKIIQILPIQVKYLYDEDLWTVEHKQVLSLPEILIDSSDAPNILICEANTWSGESAKKAIALIKERYPAANLYYSTIAQVYGGPDKFENVKEYFYGIQTNESFVASDEETKELWLRPKITIFPWETTEYELSDINFIC